MKNGSVFEDFEWEIAPKGYEWVTNGEIELLVPKPTRSVPRRYKPLSRRYHELFRSFAAVPPTREGVLAFANQYGHLGSPVLRTFVNGRLHGDIERHKFATRVGAAGLRGEVLGEPFELDEWSWASQIGRVRAVLNQWDEGKFTRAGNDPLQIDLHGTVIGMIVRKALAQTLPPDLQWHPETHSYELEYRPLSLLGAIWYQTATAFSHTKKFQKCARKGCKNLIEISRTGTRSDALFCSGPCKSRDYRRRIQVAQRLAKRGLSVRLIAQKVRSDTDTVRGWLNK
jgi:hypothetical protein